MTGNPSTTLEVTILTKHNRIPSHDRMSRPEKDRLLRDLAPGLVDHPPELVYRTFPFNTEDVSMKEDLLQAYREVEQAMERYNLVLDEYVASLRTSAHANDQIKYERMSAGTKAMLDSSSIYLSYAKFVAYGMPESEDLIEDEDLQA